MADLPSKCRRDGSTRDGFVWSAHFCRTARKDPGFAVCSRRRFYHVDKLRVGDCALMLTIVSGTTGKAPLWIAVAILALALNRSGNPDEVNGSLRQATSLKPRVSLGYVGPYWTSASIMQQMTGSSRESAGKRFAGSTPGGRKLTRETGPRVENAKN